MIVLMYRFLAFATIFVPVTSLCARPSLHSSRVRSRASSTAVFQQPQSAYSDDCFGLIFLSSSVAAKDPVFAGTFLVVSSIAVVATNVSRPLPPGKAIPGAVAGVTLLLAPLVRLLVANAELQSPKEFAPTLEVAVCVFSLVYGLVLSKDDTAG